MYYFYDYKENLLFQNPNCCTSKKNEALLCETTIIKKKHCYFAFKNIEVLLFNLRLKTILAKLIVT